MTGSLRPGRPSSDDESATALPRHLLDVKPSGNAFDAKSNRRSASGLFSLFPDELLNQVMEALDAQSLLGLGATCKALYAFAMVEDLWKSLLIEYICPQNTANLLILYRCAYPGRYKLCCTAGWSFSRLLGQY